MRKAMHTISFQVGDEAFHRFMTLSHQVQQPTDDLLVNAFQNLMEDLEDCLSATEVLNSNEPTYSLEETEQMLGLAGKV